MQGLPQLASVQRAYQPAAAAVRPDYAKSTLRIFAFWFGAGLVFLRFSMLHQVLPHMLGVNLYLLYFFAIPALAGVVLTGGLKRVFRHRTAVYWVLFGIWMALVTPFSIWRGGSAELVYHFWKIELIMLFVIAGLVVTWRECEVMFGAIAAAALVSVGLSQFFGKLSTNVRLGLEIGTVGNANDYAAHLILVLPFLLWIFMSRRLLFLRVIALGGIAFGLYLILTTGSRGALVALAISFMFVLLRGQKHRRLLFVTLAGIMMIGAVSLVPDVVVRRITSFSYSDPEGPSDATESSEARRRVLWDGVVTAAKHPLLGVGPGQFVVSQGESGKRWTAGHNSYVAAGAECGIPGFIFFVGGVWSAYVTLNRKYKEVRESSGLEEVARAIFCMRLGLVGFCTAIFFLNFTYFYYLPAMAGLAAATDSALQVEIQPEAAQALGSSGR